MLDHEMQGHLQIGGATIARAGFLPPSLNALAGDPIPSSPLFSRAATPALSAETMNHLAGLQRGEVSGDVNQILLHLGQDLAEFQRAITSATTGFPVRENLEAEASTLVPLDTPLRNRLKRVPGAGLASAWRQITSLGGTAAQAFFGESGSPAAHTTVYAAKSAGYKLLGSFGSVTGFAMASGATFQNQLATEKANQIKNLMLNEENAIINGDSTATAAPWGDGTNALAFDGVLALTATGNGTPAGQVQTSVGALTTAHIDAQLKRLADQGAQGVFMVCNGQEILSLVHLAEASGSIIRVHASSDGKTVLGVVVTGYMNPVTGEMVDVLYDRYMPAGTIWFGADRLPDGKPVVDVDVLPQVQLPELAPNQNIQGYTAQELAPSQTAAQVYAFIASVYEVVRLKSALHVAKSTGVTAV